MAQLPQPTTLRLAEIPPVDGGIILREFPGPYAQRPHINCYRLVRRPADNFEFIEMQAAEGQVFQMNVETLDRLVAEGVIPHYKMHFHKCGYVAWFKNRPALNYLHRFVMRRMGPQQDGLSVDHINRKRLDNRTGNFRLATQSMQNYNQDRQLTPLAENLIAAVWNIDVDQIEKPEQREAFLAYAHLFFENDAPDFVPSFPPHMFRTIEEAKKKDFIVIQDHPAMLEAGWLGCKTLDGQPNPSSKIWNSNKTLETSLTVKFLLALEVYHHLDLHGQVPEAIRNFRAPRGNVERNNDYPATATHIVWNSSVTTPSRNRYSIEATHPLSGGTRWYCSGSAAFTWREKLFLTVEELERRATEKHVPFVFPSFASRQRPTPELQNQYRDWKALKTAPTTTNPVELRKQQIKAAGYVKRSANHKAKLEEEARIAQKKLAESGGILDF